MGVSECIVWQSGVQSDVRGDFSHVLTLSPYGCGSGRALLQGEKSGTCLSHPGLI